MARTTDSSKLRVLVVAATLAALAGCGSGEPAARPTGGADHDKLVEAVKCMRASGFPDFPDPIQDEGFWVIPEPAAGLTPPPACLELFQGAKGSAPRRERTAEEVAQLRKWGACIRTNGIPDLPDPDSNGDFQLPPQLSPITAQPRWEEARKACEALEPSGMHFDK
ncbi:hypothetical protein OHA72_52050 [Dactylosporangium sp. NBC_01737]|uniref:hypothetical protein n=1 Tax=Dactylosporangium sp. NBC_01737 TaxID=2975959 RepID=UPI002E0FE26F|nr:hypothetical protein OHA72_52050 [Dactylosporangium sp. NBC_01737]